MNSDHDVEEMSDAEQRQHKRDVLDEEGG